MPSITLPGAVGEFAASRHGVLSQRQAVSLGLKPSDVRRLVNAQLLREAAPGVFVLVSSERTWKQQILVASLCSRGVGATGFESAAALHQIDGYPPGPLALVVPSPRRILMEGVMVHVGPLDDCDLVVIEHIRCTTIERTICDIGSVSSEFLARMAFEWYWRTHQDLGRLQVAVDRLHRPGQHGTKLVQQLLVESRMKGRPTESALEVRLEAIIGDIDGLVRQHEIFDEGGRFVARADFAVPELRIAIEAHSKEFHSSPEAQQRDLRRHASMVAAGWAVRYITAKEMDDPSRLRASIRRLLAGRDIPRPPVPPPRT